MNQAMVLFRQPWDATGSGDARSIQNAIGRTSLDLWNLLLRESLQNSWDARLDPRGSIRFEVSDFELSEEQTTVLLDEVFNELPPNCRSTALRGMTNRGRMGVLCIADLGTRGLGGPIRANVAAPDGTRADFSDFVRNFGRSSTKGLEGGTFGLGKGVLFSASRAGLCLVYSQARVGEEIEPRLIGLSGGDSDYVDKDLTKYTGRNWWGVLADDDILDPLTGPPARALAQMVGIPTPPPDDTGTCIMIIAPEVYKEEDGILPSGANVERGTRIKALRQAALTWAWPHAIDHGDGPDIHFKFRHESEELAALDPLADRDLRQFALAYTDLKATQKGADTPLTKVQALRSKPTKLGTIAARRSPEDLNGNPQHANTVALMRNPRIVVKYLPISNTSTDHYYHGVFVADPDADKDFAESEPVAHDDWVPQTKQKYARNTVRIALEHIRRFFKETSSAETVTDGSVMSQGISRLSSSLGNIVGSFAGDGVGVSPSISHSPGTSGRGLRKPSAQQAGQPNLMNIDGMACAAFSYTISGGPVGAVYTLEAKINVMADGESTDKDTNPEFGATPRLVGWRDGDRSTPTPPLITLPYEGAITLYVSLPQDTAVQADVSLVEVVS